MTSDSYNLFCDDFCVEMHVNTELDLPSERDTVLTFFERISKQFPKMGNFYRRDTGDFCLEEDRQSEQYRWVALEVDRICSGCVNPMDLEQAYELHNLILELSPYMLGVSHLDIDSLDVTFTMDFEFQGNHDEVIAEALFSNGPFGALADIPNVRPIGFSPMVTIALTEDCRTQARVTVESRTNAMNVRNNKYKLDEPISLYLTIRRYPKPYEKFDAQKSFKEQCAIAQELMAEKIIPDFVRPLTSVIAQKRHRTG